ncbi:MAG: hypothetical protein HFG71_10165 [Hungatella sp.]|jgi:hypothetical protein|nr:hypothetical protein [Hungatella sp.]
MKGIMGMDWKILFPLGMTPGAMMVLGGIGVLILAVGTMVWILATAGKRRHRIEQKMREKY